MIAELTTIRDELGQSFRPSSAGDRLVSLVPSITETLFDFGLGPRVVAVTDYCAHPAARLAASLRVGGTKNPDVAAIRSLRPTMVFTNKEENRQADVAALQAAGIRVHVSFPRTVVQAVELLEDLAALAGITGESVRIIERIRAALEVRTAALAWAAPVRTFCPIWRDPWMTFNADTYPHDLLRVSGFENVFAERKRHYPLAADLGRKEADESSNADGRDTRYPRLSLEEVAALRPDAILLPSEPYAFGEADRQELLANLDCPATGSGRVVLFDGSLLTWHGTRLLHALRELPQLL